MMWIGVTLLLASSLVSVWGQKQIAPGTNITQCEHLECPHYDLKFFNKDYEVRTYAPTKWATTAKVVPLNSEDWLDMLMKLEDYLNGKNDKGQIMPAGAPSGSIGQSFNSTHINVTLLMYIPEAFQDNTPLPLDKDVVMASPSSFSAYVRAWDGYSQTPDFSKNFALLAQSIGDPSKWVDNMYISQVYVDVLSKRRNEVWLIATGKE